MKKKLIIVSIIIIALILLIPIPMKLKDGGSIEFKAILYKITKYHRLSSIEEDVKYIDGIAIEILGKEIYNNTTKSDIKEKETFNTEGVTTTLTLEDEIQDDTIWCGTFQLIWNDLKNDLAKQDIVFNPQLKVVENLNKETFTTKELSEASYYKKIGTPSLKLKEEIEKAIKDKFNEKSDILNDFEWENRDPKDYFLYAMLKKEFQFEKAFEELENGKFRDYDNVKYFGIKSDETGELKQQVDVLYYKSKDDFAVKLRTKQEDEVILCKNPEGKTFGEIYNNILDKTEVKVYNMPNNQDNYEAIKVYGELKEGELLKVPNIKLKEKNEIIEIEDKKFLFSNGEVYSIEKALQTIEFELDRTGGKIKSEAGMMVKNESVAIMDEIREFSIDDTFAIFLIEKGKDKPYFAGKINDITKFQ